MKSQHLVQLVHFLQLAIVHLDIEVLFFVGDPQSTDVLDEVYNSLNSTLPVLQICFGNDSEDMDFETNNCPNCPTKRLTIMYLPYEMLTLGVHFVSFRYYDTNHLVLIWTNEFTISLGQLIAHWYKDYNIVVVELFKEIINVLAWNANAAESNYDGSVTITHFLGPTKLFYSNDSNALAFRRKLDYFPGRPQIQFKYNILMAPFQFHVKRPETNKTMLSSSLVHLCKLITDHLHLSLHPRLEMFKYCKGCYNPFPVNSTSIKIPLYSFVNKNM